MQIGYPLWALHQHDAGLLHMFGSYPGADLRHDVHRAPMCLPAAMQQRMCEGLQRPVIGRGAEGSFGTAGGCAREGT